MASRAKDKLQFVDIIPQYHKQQQGQIGQVNNTRTKSTKPPKHLLLESEDNSKSIKYKTRSSSNNEEVRVEKNNKIQSSE